MIRLRNVSPLSGKSVKRNGIAVIMIVDINDLSIYQIILNSEHWSVEGLGSIIDTAIAATQFS